MMRKARLWMTGFGVACLVACAEVEYPFRYISLEAVPGIQVDRIAQIAQEKLSGDSAVAVEYHLVREHYTLHFSVLEQSVLPALKVKIHGKSHSIQFYRDTNARAPNGAICASYYVTDEGSFDFGWEPECTDPKLRKAIDFDVRDGSGAVTRESIEFKLKDNGTYTGTDVI